MSTGLILAKALEHLGFYVVGDREYPSLIKGGTSCFTINFGHDPIYSLSSTPDILIALDKPCLVHYFHTLRDGGVLIHGYERTAGIQDILDEAERRNITVIHQNARDVVEEAGGTVRMKNTVLVGMAWKTLGLPFAHIKAEIETQFARKPKIIPPNIKCASLGYERSESPAGLQVEVPDKNEKTIFVDGNHALAMGAIHGGVRAYYAYPMSPSSSILSHMANHAVEFNITVKQAEDEITVANLTLGSMYAGTRALCATSGGGYDLMTETVSLTGIIETPFVCIVVQRPGPATGLPTWTGQGDLNLALYSSHGEFARMVVAVADPADAFELIQHALNFAEEYQIPVIVLSEKVIAETVITVPPFAQNTVPIKRGLVEGDDLENLKNTDRYEVTESGLSKRWLPGTSDAYFFANGDEHKADGTLDESEEAGEMYAKRCRKLELVKAHTPEPEILGDDQAEISFVGWGSSKNTLKDIVKIYEAKGIKVNYLHFSYLWPLRTEKLEKFFAENPNVHLIEGNYDGQLGGLIEKHTDLHFAGKFLKWNGRPFFVEDVCTYIDDHLKHA
jgi:2-oxoglutarate ferredoxin oxidoreductase subunit alpha